MSEAIAPARKKLCTGLRRGRIDGLAEAQNARISVERFAFQRRRRPRGTLRKTSPPSFFGSVTRARCIGAAIDRRAGGLV